MGMKEDLKIPMSMLSINFLNKLKYKGSYQGKRFMFEKYEEKEDNKVVSTVLKVYVWKDLFNFENTNEEEIIKKEFEYSKDGIEDGIKFVEDAKI